MVEQLSSETSGSGTVFACASCGKQSTSMVGKQVDGLWYCFTCAGKPREPLPSNPLDGQIAAELTRLAKHYGGYTRDILDTAALRLTELARPAPETECVATPETSIDMAHSQAWSAFARRHGGEGPSLPSEDRWCDGYMCALLDIGRGKATELKANAQCWDCKRTDGGHDLDCRNYRQSENGGES